MPIPESRDEDHCDGQTIRLHRTSGASPSTHIIGGEKNQLDDRRRMPPSKINSEGDGEYRVIRINKSKDDGGLDDRSRDDAKVNAQLQSKLNLSTLVR
jgi:hypothetical protein